MKYRKLIIIGLIVLLVVSTGTNILQCINDAQAASEGYNVKAMVSGKVADKKGIPLVAQVMIINQDTSNKTRINTDMLGYFNMKLEEGSYQLVISKGPEYSREKIDVEAAGTKPIALENIILSCEWDMASKNWYAGDLHQHSLYSDGAQSVSEIWLSNIANGGSWGMLSDHNTLAGAEEWLNCAKIGIEGTNAFVSIIGWEVTTNDGHYQAINVACLFDYTIDDNQDLIDITQEIKKDGGIAQINHPFASGNLGFARWDCVDYFDTIEIWNGKAPTNSHENEQVKNKWFELLNEGHKIAASAGSDNHDITGKYMWARDDSTDQETLDWLDRGMYSLSPMMYVYTEDMSVEGITSAIKRGNTFLTNGPLLIVDIDGSIPGQVVSSGETNQLNIQMYSTDTVDRIKIIKNGQVLQTIEVGSSRTYSDKVKIAGQEGDWIVVEAEGQEASYAITNPIFLD